MKKIAVVDDDQGVAASIESILERRGFDVDTYESATSFIDGLDASGDIDLVLTDVCMPGLDGIAMLRRLKERSINVPVIVFTGFGDVDTAVRAMKAGASDFLCKPVGSDELLFRVRKVLEKHKLSREVAALRKRLATTESFHELVGRSTAMVRVFELIEAVAATDATVLITGETGTGKELVAKAIHAASSRADEPYVAISCTALQDTLLESELFGHEKGSFTGAVSTRVGRLEAACGGTVLLDEVGDTSAAIQSKLLRVIEERQFERVGSSKPIKLKARLLAATSRDLDAAMRQGAFREDLYYRLDVVRIDMPPLREREDDVVLLANHFLEKFSALYDKEIEGFAPEAVNEILSYHWPGNVREMKNVIERTVLTSGPGPITRLQRLGAARGRPAGIEDLPERLDYASARESLSEELERTYLTHYMERERGRIGAVAEAMGVSVRTVTRMLKRHGLDKREFK
ncbi:MAG TPA: sigma-54-dependent Fis family transcriptional regulator [Deltaproteobacteria bacterium]|nr:sigma-54-dependent Fis family transcriptional regulator [Deltaproteobacteria bacterium]